MDLTLPRIPRPRLGAPLAFLLLASCSILGLDAPETIRLTNGTASAILIQAWELQTSYAVDPAPQFTVDPTRDTVLLPGEVLVLTPEEVEGEYRPGMDLALFLFEVEGETAYFRQVKQVPGEEIRKRDGRLRITDF